jgi:hypothetical protein
MTTLPIPGRPPAPSSAVAEFLDRLKGAPNAPSPGGRLIFALDATASREPTWDIATGLTYQMFAAVAGIGTLVCQLVYFRGFNECRASRWVTSAGELQRLMRTVKCDAGITQLGRVLDHAIREAGIHPIGAVVFVGDAVEEPIDRLAHLAATLGRPLFLLHEGGDPNAERAFRQLAAAAHGVYLPFDLAGIDRLKELLGAIAIYATGGIKALEKHAAGNTVLLQITSQLRR